MSDKKELPLVSILIPNYNYSRYLDQCIQSAIHQTYPHKEIIFCDNSSTDDSVKVAAKYRKDGVMICRNQCNIMNYNYRLLTEEYCRGKYFILLCTDDYLLPDFIETAVAIMEKYPDVGYVHGERDFVTSENKLVEQDPFYKCSFVAPGKKTMPVYMVATVAHPSQGVIRREAFQSIGGYDMEIDCLNADRSLWFYLSYQYDSSFICRKMSRIRVGIQSETAILLQNFQMPVLYHLIIKDFVNFAQNYNLPEVYEREGEALQRLAKEFVGYAGNMLYMNHVKQAEAYLKYAKIVFRDVVNEGLYQAFNSMIQKNLVDKRFIEQQNQEYNEHKRSYEPPQGYMEINPEELVRWLRQKYRF